MSTAADRPIVVCVDEVQQLGERYRDTPPDPATVAALHAALACGGLFAGMPGGGKTYRPVPLSDKEIEP